MTLPGTNNRLNQSTSLTITPLCSVSAEDYKCQHVFYVRLGAHSNPLEHANSYHVSHLATWLMYHVTMLLTML